MDTNKIIFRANREQWERLQALLRLPPRDLPKLRRLTSRPSPFSEEDR